MAAGRATTHAIDVRRPIMDVFAVITDVTRTATWFPAQVEEWWVTPPPHRIGSIRRARVRFLGRASENDAVVTAFDPPHHAELRGLSRSAPFVVNIRCESAAGGTRVEVTTAFGLRGLLRVVGPLFIPRYGRAWERGLANLKRMMESGELFA